MEFSILNQDGSIYRLTHMTKDPYRPLKCEREKTKKSFYMVYIDTYTIEHHVIMCRVCMSFRSCSAPIYEAQRFVISPISPMIFARLLQSLHLGSAEPAIRESTHRTGLNFVFY